MQQVEAGVERRNRMGYSADGEPVDIWQRRIKLEWLTTNPTCLRSCAIPAAVRLPGGRNGRRSGETLSTAANAVGGRRATLSRTVEFRCTSCSVEHMSQSDLNSRG